MELEIANETDGVVRVVLYKKSLLRPAEPAVAWALAAPPSRGRAIFSIPREYRVVVRYSFSPGDPAQPVYQTNALSLPRTNDSLSLREVHLGRSAWGAVLARDLRKSGREEVLRVHNDFFLGVWCHVQLGERDVHLPRILPPRCVLIESLAAPFYLAVVGPHTREGAPLAEHETCATELALEPGESGVFTVHGSPSQGYRITRGAPPPAERAPQPKETAPRAERAPQRKATGRSRTKPKEEPHAPARKPKPPAKSNAALKKRETTKKPASRQSGRGTTKTQPRVEPQV